MILYTVIIVKGPSQQNKFVSTVKEYNVTWSRKMSLKSVKLNFYRLIVYINCKATFNNILQQTSLKFVNMASKDMGNWKGCNPGDAKSIGNKEIICFVCIS